MAFGKAVAKGEGQIVSEYKELSLKEQLEEAIETNKSLRARLMDVQTVASRFARLRELEVVIMAEDGAKYLKGYELDEYIDSLPMKNRVMTRAELLKELTPELNNIFAKEYAKYQDEHADAFAAQIDAEVMRNVHKA